MSSPSKKPLFLTTPSSNFLSEGEDYQMTINSTTNTLSEASKESTDQETRILDFLQEKGVEFKSPWEKVHEYFEKQKKRRFSETEIEDASNKEFSFSKGHGLTLNSKLYCKRVKTLGKNAFQSP